MKKLNKKLDTKNKNTVEAFCGCKCTCGCSLGNNYNKSYSGGYSGVWGYSAY